MSFFPVSHCCGGWFKKNLKVYDVINSLNKNLLTHFVWYLEKEIRSDIDYNVKACKPDNYEPHNSLKLSFTNIWGLRLNLVDCESFLESNSPEILAPCETNLDDSIDSGNFSVRGYLPLIWKDSSTHMHGLTVYVKEGISFARDLSLKNSADSYLCFRLELLHSVSYFFFLYGSPSSALCRVFDSISSNIDEILSINPSATVFAFGDLNVHHNDRWNWSTWWTLF